MNTTTLIKYTKSTKARLINKFSKLLSIREQKEYAVNKKNVTNTHIPYNILHTLLLGLICYRDQLIKTENVSDLIKNRHHSWITPRKHR